MAERLDANFGGVVRLLGWSAPAADQYVLYWRSAGPIADDLQVSLRLIDVQGFPSGQVDRRPAGYLYPAMRWRADEVIPGQGRLPADAGSPPGPYFLEVRLYRPSDLNGFDILDAAGAPQGKSLKVGPFRLEDGGRASEQRQVAFARSLEQMWAGVAVRGASALPAVVVVGQPLTVETVWQCDAPTGRPLGAAIRITSSSTTALQYERDLLLMTQYPTTRWHAGEWLRSRERFWLPADWPGGPADVQLVVADERGIVEPMLALGQVQVDVPPRQFTAPQLTVVSGAHAGASIQLLGIVLEPAQPKAGDAFAVTLYWQPTAQVYSPYTAFVLVLDGSGAIVAQSDRTPAEGNRPTTGWIGGEVVADRYAFPKWLAGASLGIGLYEADRAGMPRLGWSDAAGLPLGDELHLLLPATP